jgi:regulatory protein
MRRKPRRILPDNERKITDRENSRQRTLNRAVKLLAAKPRSVAELRERLLEKSWTDEAIVEDVIARLSGYGYLDDERFAKDLALAKLRQKPQGRRRLKHTLETKKLDGRCVESALESAYQSTPESELIKSAIERKLRRSRPPQTREEAKRLFDYLVRLGFDYELIRSELRRLGTGKFE